MILHLRAAVQQLYAAAPSRFTALRSELVAEAKQAGDTDLAQAITALRKPTVAAWAVNHFVRTCEDEVADFREFAELLRTAQRTLDADQLRALGRERTRRVDQLTERVAAQAAEAGQPLGASVRSEVRDTLIALVADEQAEVSVLTASLVRALSYSGFGSVDIDDVVALRGPDLALVPHADPGVDAEEEQTDDLQERRRAKRAAVRARLAAALDEASKALTSADRQVAVLAARHEEVTEGIADLERRLATARSRLEKVTGELDEASGIRDDREADCTRAQEALAKHDAAD